MTAATAAAATVAAAAMTAAATVPAAATAAVTTVTAAVATTATAAVPLRARGRRGGQQGRAERRNRDQPADPHDLSPRVAIAVTCLYMWVRSWLFPGGILPVQTHTQMCLSVHRVAAVLERG